MTHSPSLVNFIATFEGLRLTAYRDGNGILTIGYGHTGPDVYEGQVITKVQALLLLNSDLATTDAQVTNAIKVPVTQNQFDALVSLTFNIGIGRFAGNKEHKPSTVLIELNNKNYTAAADAFLMWVQPGSVNTAGLLKRRQAEKTLYLTP